MYEYHGWATIRETATCDEEDNMEKIVINIKEYINHLNWSNGILDLNVVNGDYQLIVAGLTNHKGYEAKELFKLYNYIAKEAAGSYGLLYIWDDEDKDGSSNKFQVHVLVRGQVKLQEDPFLSPCIPVIEDKWV